MTTWFRGWLLGNSHFTTTDKAERRLAARTDGQKEARTGMRAKELIK